MKGGFSKLPAEVLRQQKGTSFVGVSTCFLCYSKDGQCFMAKRSSKARDEPGRWDNGGGGLKWGVTAEDNVRREVEEEYAATPLKIDFLGYRDVFRQLADGTPTHWLAIDFAVLVNKDEVKINEPEIFDDSGWFVRWDEPSPLHSQIPFMLKKYVKEIEKVMQRAADV